MYEMQKLKKKSETEMKKVLFIFGAGASYDAGAPTQGQIFQKYFEKHGFEDDENDILKQFFQKIFLIDFSSSNKYSSFPTFEEVLGILEFAIQNNASLGRDFHIENIRILKERVINLMAKTIKESSENPKNKNHEILIDNLFKENIENEFTYSFINLNYDILLDNALINLYNNFNNKIYLDYGIELWRNYLNGNWSKSKDPRVYLLKPHGSLNWFYCPSCNSIYLNVKGKPEFKETEIEPIIPECTYCNSKQTLFIVPPTFFKTLTNLHVTTILQNIQKEVVNSDYLVFVGYSFPDADLHLKYIIKKAFQFLAKSREIIVIEKEFNSSKKDSPDINLLEVYRRYERIFKNFYFIPIGFENFSKSPFEYLNSPSAHCVEPENLDITRWHYILEEKYDVNENEIFEILRKFHIPFYISIDWDFVIPDFENPLFYITLIKDFNADFVKDIIAKFQVDKKKYTNLELILIISNYWADEPVFEKGVNVFYFEKLSELIEFLQR